MPVPVPAEQVPMPVPVPADASAGTSAAGALALAPAKQVRASGVAIAGKLKCVLGPVAEVRAAWLLATLKLVKRKLAESRPAKIVTIFLQLASAELTVGWTATRRSVNLINALVSCCSYMTPVCSIVRQHIGQWT